MLPAAACRGRAPHWTGRERAYHPESEAPCFLCLGQIPGESQEFFPGDGQGAEPLWTLLWGAGDLGKLRPEMTRSEEYTQPTPLQIRPLRSTLAHSTPVLSYPDAGPRVTLTQTVTLTHTNKSHFKDSQTDTHFVFILVDVCETSVCYLDEPSRSSEYTFTPAHRDIGWTHVA